MDKLNFKIYNLNILQEIKTAWENDEIENPRFSLKEIESLDLTLEEAEELIIENIRNSFKDLREVIGINHFSDAKLIMPAFQMCSDDKLDVIDFGFNIINPNVQDDMVDSYDGYSDDESLSDLNNTYEILEEFAQVMNDEIEELLNDEKVENIDVKNEIKDEYQSESELEFIKKSINGDI